MLTGDYGYDRLKKLIKVKRSYFLRSTRRSKMKINIKKYKSFIFFLMIILLCGCSFQKEDIMKDYGVFLSLDASDMNKIEGYRTVVIDAQYFSQNDIAHLQEQGSKVYSYINIGSLENFRDYYDTYSDLTLGDYANWEEEKWINAASPVWQEFLVSLEEELLGKGIDGFFADNCDVYYEYPTDEIFDGLTEILKHIMGYGKPVIINGGDTYVTQYREMYGSAKEIMTGVNQESVWSRIDFETGTLSEQTKADREYFEAYVEACRNDGADVFLIEYTTYSPLKKQIENYCSENGFRYYISDSVELD